ncbi:MAG: FixH family protein [Acidobacteria bacterium]|nr:FixH family protein [Acidobacteriota bacterium]
MKSSSKWVGILFVLAVGGYFGYQNWRGGQETASAEQSASGHETHGTAASTGERKVLYWYDPMHPTYTSDKPGVAPDGGIQLVPKYADEADGPEAPPAGPAARLGPEAIQYAPVQMGLAQQRLIGVTTGSAEMRSLKKAIRTVGRVDMDETRIARVHTKISGWVEEVFADYTFQHVQQGAPLFSIYSPDLVSTQEELLLALKARENLSQSPFASVSAGAESLLEATRRRLTLWDISPAQIEEIERTGQVQRKLMIYSPISGHIMQRNVFPRTFVTPETELYTIVDHSRVWIYADIYESEMGLVRLGQQAVATTEAYPGEPFRGQVSYIWPHLERETRTLKVRMEFPNPDLKLKPEMYTHVELDIPLGRRLVVPDSAIIDTGQRQVVFVVQAPGTFVPRDVRLGVRADGSVEVREGLKAGEQVVTSANFLIDSESQLRAALGAMTLGSGVTEIGGQVTAAQPSGPQARVQFQSQPSPPRAGNNRLTVTVTDAAGAPVPDAAVRVVFYMPAMPAMGMAAMRAEATLSSAGGGIYEGPIEVPTAGTWQVSVTAEKAGTLLASEQLTVNAQP